MGKSKEKKKKKELKIGSEDYYSLQLRDICLKEEIKSLLTISITLLVVYLYTLAPTVTLEDSGVILTAVNFMGIPHPPGYPLFTFLGKIFSYLPFAEKAVSIGFLSTLSSIISSLCIYLITRHLLDRKSLAFCAAFLYSFAATIWYYASVVEFYALNTSFFFLIFLLSLRQYIAPTEKRLLIGSIVFGLSLSNHWPLMVLSSVSFWILLIPSWKLIKKNLIKILGLFLIGILPYIHIYLTSQGNPEIAMFGPVKDFSEFFRYITRGHYLDIENQKFATWEGQLNFIWLYLKMIFWEYNLVAFLVIPLGLSLLYKIKEKYVSFSIFWSLIGSSILYLVFAKPEFDTLTISAYKSYQSVPLGMFTLVIIVGVDFLVKKIEKEYNDKIRRILVLFILIFFPFFTFVQNFKHANLHQERFSQIFAQDVLNTLPQNAKLFNCCDSDLGPLSYEHYVNKTRPDIEMFSQFGYLYNNRLFNLYKQDYKSSISALQNFMDTNKTIYAVEYGPIIQGLKNVKVKNFGLYYEVSQVETGFDPSKELIERSTSFLNRVEKGEFLDFWPYHRDIIIGNYCEVLTTRGIEHAIFKKNKRCKLFWAQYLEKTGDHKEASRIFKELIAEYKSINPVNKDYHELFYQYFQSSVYTINSLGSSPELMQKELSRLVNEVLEGIEIFPICENKVLIGILKVGTQIKLPIDWNKILTPFSQCSYMAKAKSILKL